MSERTYNNERLYGFGATAVAAHRAGRTRTTRILTLFVALLSAAILSVFVMLHATPAEALEVTGSRGDGGLGLAATVAFVASTILGMMILLAPLAITRRSSRRRFF